MVSVADAWNSMTKIVGEINIGANTVPAGALIPGQPGRPDFLKNDMVSDWVSRESVGVKSVGDDAELLMSFGVRRQ
jgi:hypothetical protein